MRGGVNSVGQFSRDGVASWWLVWVSIVSVIVFVKLSASNLLVTEVSVRWWNCCSRVWAASQCCWRRVAMWSLSTMQRSSVVSIGVVAVGRVGVFSLGGVIAFLAMEA